MYKRQVLEIVGAQTFKNDLSFEHFGVKIGVTIMTTDLEVDVTIHLEVEKLQAVVAFLVAIDKGILGDLELGQILESDGIFKCLLSTAHFISIPLLDVSVADIVSFEIEGFDDPTVQKLTDLTLDVFREVILQKMGRVFNFSIRMMLNNWIEHM